MVQVDFVTGAIKWLVPEDTVLPELRKAVDGHVAALFAKKEAK